MAFFNEFPNTRTYDKDLGWLIHVVGQLQIEVKTFIENNTINIPDQITWDITKQYTRNTLVIDYDGTAYLSKQPVPVGIAITNTDYWMPIFNYDDSINTLRDNIAANERNHTTASAERHEGDLVWLGNALYKVTVDMPAGTAYIIGTNVTLYTVADYLVFLKNAIASETHARESADTILQGNIDAEVLARQGADNTLQGNIDAEVLERQNAGTVLQSQINIANMRINNWKWLTIGDSYGTGYGNGSDGTYTPWSVYLQQYLGIPDSRFFRTASGGSGFCAPGNSGTFKQLFIDFISGRDDLNQFSTVVIEGVTNDRSYSSATILEAIEECVNTIKANMSHANIYIAPCFWTPSLFTWKNDVLINSLPAYTACQQFGAKLLSGMEYALHRRSWMDADGLHPNNDGQKHLARQMFNAIMQGSCDNIIPFELGATVTQLTGWSGLDEMFSRMYVRICNESTFITFLDYAYSLVYTGTLPSGTFYKIGEVVSDVLAPIVGTFSGSLNIGSGIISDGNGAEACQIQLSISNGKDLYLKCVMSRTYNNPTLTVSPGMTTWPTIAC